MNCFSIKKNQRNFSKSICRSTLILMLLLSVGGNVLAQQVTSTSVTLTWTSPGDDSTSGTASVYDIRYSLSAITAANWSNATQATGEPSPQTAGSSETFTVQNLASSTTYYFAICTGDEVPNWSVLSNVISRTTLAEVIAPAAIANLTLNTPTLNSITLHWTAPGDDGATGQASVYDIRYSTSPITTGTVWNNATQVTGETAPKPTGFAESFTVGGLSPSTTYYFAIKTADEVPNWSEISNVPNLATATEQTPPSAIAGLFASNVTGSSVRLNWIAPGDDGNTGTANLYDIRYSTSPITAANWNTAISVTGEPAPLVAGTSQSYTVSGLNIETTYYFAIKTVDEASNWSGLSNVISVTTIDDIPPAPVTDLAVILELARLAICA
jgi:chitodextrinase